MLHVPWGRKESEFPQDGTAIIRCVRAFVDHGGDPEALCELLSQHLSNPRFTVTPEGLVQSDRRYSYEFYFYLFVFAKTILEDPGFRYMPTRGDQLESFHNILEQGPMRFDPWQCDECGSFAGQLSITNMLSMFMYVEEVIEASPSSDAPNGERTISRDALNCLNSCVSESFRVDRGFFDKEELLISMEYLLYLSEIFIMLTNDKDFVYNALYYGFLHDSKLARSIFSQPAMSPVEGFMLWQTRTNNLYRMEFRQRPQRLDVRLHLRNLFNTGMLGAYREASVDGIQKACLGVHRAFMELATRHPVRTRILQNDGLLNEFTVRIRWQTLRFTPIALSMAIIGTAGYVGASLLAFQHAWPAWSRVLVSGVAGASITGLIIALAISRKRTRIMKRQFADTRTVIDEQYVSLKETSAELLQERNALEEKVRLRTAELEDALSSLTRLDHAKTNFLANITHELRTPLTLLSVPMENVRAGRYGSSIPVDHPVFELVQRNLNRLNHQIKQLLDYTRLDLGAMPFHLQVVPLVAYVRGLVAELESLAERRGLALVMINRTTRHEVYISVDQTMLETALLNLINNALKFTEKGEVRLVVGPELDNTMVRVSVEDTGIGFDSHLKESLFERFVQCEDRPDRRVEGAGLGLALVREIAVQNGWRLDAEGRRGEGATFSVDIPVSTASGSDDAHSVPSGTDRVGRTAVGLHAIVETTPGYEDRGRNIVLLIDDNPDMGTLVSDVLEPEFFVVWCRSGEEALRYLSEHPLVSLVVCDVMMPGMSGFALRERLVEEPAFKDIPFVFLTALDDVEDRFRGLSGGALDYIRKPFKAAELRLKVRNILDLQDARYRQALSDSAAVERLSRLGAAEKTEAADRASLFRDTCITPAELRVLELLREGLQDKEIADRLSISPRTVASHLHRLYRKTETGNRLELMAWMVNGGAIGSHEA